MLRLNPNDNQGVRYTLAGRLLASRTSGAGHEAGEYLNEAVRRNKHVPPYLLSFW